MKLWKWCGRRWCFDGIGMVIWRRFCRLDDACFCAGVPVRSPDDAAICGAQGAIAVVAEAAGGGDVAGFCIVHMGGRGRGYVVTLDVAEGGDGAWAQRVR